MGQWRGHDKAEGPPVANGVYLDANENPLGPSSAAIRAGQDIFPSGGRYHRYLTNELVRTFASQEGLKPEYIVAYPGSSVPLSQAIVSYTSPQRSFVTVDPGYDGASRVAEAIGSRVVKAPLTSAFEHDVKAMIAHAPDAGILYVCNPNNPTGTITSREKIEYLLAHKPKDAIVIVDEAYIHYTSETSAIDLVRRDQDVIVLRTFSKIYGMAGLRCGLAIARPDLLARMGRFGRVLLPIPSVVAAKASLDDRSLVLERKKEVANVREETFDWLRSHHYSYIPSVTNFFQLDTKRPGQEVIDLMSDHQVFIGRVWPIMPTWVRVTVGTRPEMERFKTVLQQVIETPTAASNRIPRASLNAADDLIC
jgi:histidinol-phosphate aminotransferase